MQADGVARDGDTEQIQLGSGTVEFRASEVASIEPLSETAEQNPILRSGTTTTRDSQELLQKAAYNAGLQPEIVRSVAKVESAYRVNAVSRKGAIGLMQLMPATAAQLRVDINAPEENAQGGANYLRTLLIRYKGDSALALAAYNAGPNAVDRFGGVPPFEETRRYVVKVIQEYERERKLSLGGKSSEKQARRPSATD